MKTTTLIHSLEELDDLAKEFSSELHANAVIRLDGQLGAGKTHFVKSLARALGYSGEVSSPTFPLVHEYRWPRHFLVHMDFYRLVSDEEINRAGLEEYLQMEAVTVVEWASRFPNFFPADSWRVQLEIISETTREVTIESPDR